jgi:hypothetical protein
MAGTPRGHLVVVREALCMALFACGVIASGLAAIHFIWLHPGVIGPFALPIGMTPLVMLFEYSLEVPAYWMPLGAVLAGTSWFLLLRNPPHPMIVRVVLTVGAAVVIHALGFVVLASICYNDTWVRPASRAGEVGLMLLATGLLSKATLDHPGASGD